jgi:capsular polysaccharide transport system permease protein
MRFDQTLSHTMELPSVSPRLSIASAPLMSQLTYQFRVQLRVFLALLSREWHLNFGHRTFGVFGQFLGMSLHIGAFTVTRLVLGASMHRGMEIVPFIATGVLCFWTMKRAVRMTSSGLVADPVLTWFPQITALDVALVRSFVGTIVQIGIGLGMFVLLMAVGLSKSIDDLPNLILIGMVTGLLGTGFGLILGTSFRYFPFIRSGAVLAFDVIMVLSGVFYLIPEVPYAIRGYVLYNPLAHLSDMMRGAYFSVYESTQSSPTYVLGWTIATLAFGLMSERASRHKVIRR